MLNEMELRQEIKRLEKQISNNEKRIQNNCSNINNLENAVIKSNELGRNIENLFSDYIFRIKGKSASLNRYNKFGERYQEEVKKLLNSSQNRAAINRTYDLTCKAKKSISEFEDENNSLQREKYQVEEELIVCRQKLNELLMRGK